MPDDLPLESGSYLNNAFIEKRNLVISFEMRDVGLEKRRHALCRVVKPSRYIKVFYKTAGILGGICATFGVVMPSFIVILIVTKCFDRFRSSKAVSSCMAGLKPAVVGMIGSAVVSVGMTVFFPSGFSTAVFTGTPFYLSLFLFVGAVILAFRKVHPVLPHWGSQRDMQDCFHKKLTFHAKYGIIR